MSKELNRMPKTIVLMTALLPTIGHEFLIRFAANLGYWRDVRVIISTRSFEPISGKERLAAFKQTFKDDSRVGFYLMEDDSVPQEPHDHPDFWNVWGDLIKQYVGEVDSRDIFVASELYGIDVARVLGCQFLPCDIDRQVFPVKGTNIRDNIIDQFDQILPAFRKNLQKTVVLFGAESTGKTTMANALAQSMNGIFVPEYAREYLETLGTDITGPKMVDIMIGQASFQKSVVEMNHNKPFVFFDTNLLSTLGYYRIFEKKMGVKLEGSDPIEKLCIETKADLYVVMNDNIPFEQDIIRYGGDQRESKTQFWIDMLHDLNCDYIIVPHGTHEQQKQFIQTQARLLMNESKIKKFKR